MIFTCSLFLAMSLVEPIPKESEGRIVIVRTSPEPAELILLKADGTVLKKFETKVIEGHIHTVRLSPDRSQVLLISNFLISPGKPPPKSRGTSGHLIDLNRSDMPAKLVFENLASVSGAAWSPDGKKLYVSDVDEAVRANPNEPIPFRGWVFNVSNGSKDQLELPTGYCIVDLSPDGKMLLMGQERFLRANEDLNKYRAAIVPLDTLKPSLISEMEFVPKRWSPDGKLVIGFRHDWSDPKKLRSIDVINNTVTKEELSVTRPENVKGLTTSYAFANNGKELAFIWSEPADPDNKQVPMVLRSRLCIANRHGQNFKELYKTEGLHRPMIFDWR
jgi:hypothetical protein